VGLAFHVGSQATQAHAYLNALKVCRSLFDDAVTYGLNLQVLDIGGGFPIRAPGSAKINIDKMVDNHQ